MRVAVRWARWESAGLEGVLLGAAGRDDAAAVAGRSSGDRAGRRRRLGLAGVSAGVAI